MTRKVITIFGGSGMIGRLIARRYAKKGYAVRVAVRRPNTALFVRTYGEVGQVNPIQANIRDEASVARAVEGADIVVNAVSILYETRFQTFDEVQGEDPGRIARLAKAAGVKQFVQISALGADEEGPSRYARSKAKGEAVVLAEFANALIVRPSVVFGGENDFFNKIGKPVRWSWMMPVVSAKTKFQPVYADDVAEFVERALDKNLGGVYELGGKDVVSMREVVEYIVQSSRRRRFVFNMPHFLAAMMAYGLQALQFITLYLIKNRVLTPDQLKQLAVDNIVSDKNGLDVLKIVPEGFRAIEEPYMESLRPQGEFEDLVKAKI